MRVRDVYGTTSNKNRIIKKYLGAVLACSVHYTCILYIR